jgi:hypothetical protein
VALSELGGHLSVESHFVERRYPDLVPVTSSPEWYAKRRSSRWSGDSSLTVI